MNLSNFYSKLLIFVFIFSICNLLVLFSHAYETDQFTTPPLELDDIGAELSQFTYDRLQKSITEINTFIVHYPELLAQAEKELGEFVEQNPQSVKWTGPRNNQHPYNHYQQLKIHIEQLRSKFNRLRTAQGVIATIYENWGWEITWQDQRDGVFGLQLSIISKKKNSDLIHYHPGRLNTIYSFAGFHRLISPSYFVFSSTIRAYNYYFGVDKLGHFFNQGYQLHKLYQQGLDNNLNSKESLDQAIQWSANTENTFWGRYADGVYSNADLAANYTGFLFYQNLFESITINNQQFDAILKRLENETLIINITPENSSSLLLKRFISNHLNEAFNPSYYEYLQRVIIKKAIKNRCSNFLNFYQIQSKKQAQDLTDSMKTWFGTPYGHKENDLLRIDQICF